MLTIHHLNNSRSQRILWLCEELGVEYQLVKHMRDSETLRAPPALAKIHALGKAPTIEHEGQVIVESDAIIEYICNVCAGGRLSHGGDGGTGRLRVDPAGGAVGVVVRLIVDQIPEAEVEQDVRFAVGGAANSDSGNGGRLDQRGVMAR